MKKKVIKMILVVMGFFLCTTNVEALDLPQEYTTNGISYTIESFSINIYEGGVDQNNIPNYFNGNKKLLSSSTISNDEISIDPVDTILLDSSMNGSFIDLNLNIGNDEFANLIKMQPPVINNDNSSYYAEIVANYKITSMPDLYNYINRFNVLEFAFSLFSKGVTPFNVNDVTSQVIDIARYSKENGTEEFVFGGNVIKDIGTEDSTTEVFIDSSMGMLDYAILSDIPEINSVETPATTYNFMLHNSDEFTNAILNGYYDQEENTTSENQNQPAEIVKTGNTSMNVSTVIYVASAFFAIIGIGLIVVSKKKSI